MPRMHSLMLAVLVLIVGAFASVPVGNAQSPSQTDVIADVILKFNQASAEATSTRDASPMRPYVTDDFYQEMRFEMQSAWAEGLDSLTLVDIEWGTISVQGDTATGYTLETWAFQLTDGTADEFPSQLNLYRLVREGGTWKVMANDHP